MSKDAPVQAIVKAAEILRCFYTHEELGLTELSQELGYNKSTAAGLVASLRHVGFLEQNERGHLILGRELFYLGSHVNIHLSDICRPYLEKMCADSGETVNLAIRDGAMVAYLNKIESAHSVRICTSIGQRLPFYCTAVGKAIFSCLDREETERAFASAVPHRLTQKTITDLAQLQNDLDISRERGYALDIEELEAGLICVAVPIIDKNGYPIAAVSISGPSQRMTDAAIEQAAVSAMEAAEQISAKYRYYHFESSSL